MPAGNAYHSGHLVPSPYGGLHMLRLLRPVFPTLHRFTCNDRTALVLHRIKRGFHVAFATDVACQQGALTLPDTRFRPHFGTCLSSNVETRFLKLAMSLLDFSPWIPLGTFLNLFSASHKRTNNTQESRNMTHLICNKLVFLCYLWKTPLDLLSIYQSVQYMYIILVMPFRSNICVTYSLFLGAYL